MNLVNASTKAKRWAYKLRIKVNLKQKLKTQKQCIVFSSPVKGRWQVLMVFDGEVYLYFLPLGKK